MTLTAGGITRAASASARMNVTCPVLKDSKASAQTASASTAMGPNAGWGVAWTTIAVVVSATELGGDVRTSNDELLVLALVLVDSVRPVADGVEVSAGVDVGGLVDGGEDAAVRMEVKAAVLIGAGAVLIGAGVVELVVELVGMCAVLVVLEVAVVVLHLGHQDEKVFIVIEVFQNSTSPTMLPCQLSPVPPIHSKQIREWNR